MHNNIIQDATWHNKYFSLMFGYIFYIYIKGPSAGLALTITIIIFNLLIKIHSYTDY